MNEGWHGRDQTLVLVPGMLCDTELFSPQLESLRTALDVHVADITRDDSLERMAEQILDEIRGPFALLGFSMGGYVAQTLIRRAPRRVTRLALLATNARGDLERQKVIRRAQVAAVEAGGFDAVVDQLIAAMMPAHRSVAMGLAATVRAMMSRVGPEAFVKQTRAVIARADNRQGLPEIRVPVVCIVGEDDGITPPKVHQEMVDRVPGAKLVLLARCGHFSTLEQPGETIEAIRDWLLS